MSSEAHTCNAFQVAKITHMYPHVPTCTCITLRHNDISDDIEITFSCINIFISIRVSIKSYLDIQQLKMPRLRHLFDPAFHV